MHGRKLVTSGTVAALAILAIVGGCREATTGPTSVKPQDFASSVKLLSGNQQTGAVGAALSEVLSVKVVDAGGVPVAGATVLWQVRDGGGSLNPAASTTGSTGLATVTWTLGTTLGANKAVAVLQGSYVLDSAVFTATAKVGPAQKFVLSSGNLQTARVTSTLPAALVVNVKDQYGYPVAGVKVTWATALFSGTIAANADSTDVSGNASARWTLGQSAIGQSATATVAGLAPLVFNATGTADTTRVLTIVSGGNQSAAAGAAAPTPLKVKVADQFGNIIAGAQINWADSSSGGGTPAALASVTGADGTASTTWRFGVRVGEQLLRIKEVGRGSTVTVTGTATVTFSDVQAGNFHACALSTTSRIYCWGLNDVGQLGKGTNLNTSTPSTAISITGDTTAGANTLTARQLTGSRSSTCALTIAEAVYCWGRRWGGSVTTNLPLPVDINAGGGSGGPLAISYLQVSEDHGCLIQASGVANCTGNNDQGQMGDRSVAVGGVFPSPAANTWPYVDALRTFSNIKLGTTFSCGFHRYLTEGTTVPLVPDSSQVPLCWGDGAAGQRGDSTTLNGAAQLASTPKHIKVTGLPLATVFDSLSLAVGDKHACAVVAATSATGAGDAYCWGLNAHGQLGRVTTGVGNTARDSAAGKVSVVPALVRLFAGKYHTCGLTAAGATYCWGRNDYGQLGDGTRTTFNVGTSTPAAVSTGLTFRSLTLGELFTCGVTGTPGTAVGASASAGTVYCWGDNTFGQVGNAVSAGGNAPVLSPTKVFYQP